MSDADLAYAAAVAEIARVRAEGGKKLDLSSLIRCRALTKLPDVIAGWLSLEFLNLDLTQVGDSGLFPIRESIRLKWLSLRKTQVTDSGLEHLKGLVGLERLSLRQTSVTGRGLTHLKDLPNLTTLYLNQTSIKSAETITDLKQLQSLEVGSTQIGDLRPIYDLQPKSQKRYFGIRYYRTPAVDRDPKLAELAKINDAQERTVQTLAYLKSLPPWPEPLPWLEEGATPTRPTRIEPTLTRDGGVKASATQIKFLLREPQMTRITAQGIAGQLRAALIDVQPVRGNELPEPIVAILAIADSLDALGQTDISPKAKSRDADLRMRIAHLEGVVDRLNIALKDSNAARDAALAMANKDSALKAYAKSVAVSGGVLTVVLVGAGVFAGASAILGNTNPYVTALQSGLGILTK